MGLFKNKETLRFKEDGVKSSHTEVDGATAYKQKMSKKSKITFILLGVYTFILACLALITNGNLGNLTIIIAGISVLVIFIANFIWHMSEREYYSLPGSGYSPSRHTCVFCGNRGIHKSTIYQSNIVRHYCSRCDKELFRRY